MLLNEGACRREDEDLAVTAADRFGREEGRDDGLS